jgi:predicted phosphodiesterase
MKLLILSDLHLEFAPFEPARDIEADVVILAGDIGRPGRDVPLWTRRTSAFGNKEVIFVAGNHEYYRTELQQERIQTLAEAMASGVHFLDPGQVVLGGVRFIGATLWTDFALRIPEPGRSGQPGQRDRLVSNVDKAMNAAQRGLNDFYRVRSGDAPFTPAQALALHCEEREYLLRTLREPFDGPTVVVTHHAPHRGSLAPRYESDWLSPCFVSELPDECFEVPKLWVHGHTHTQFDYRVGNCRVLSNPRGYPLADGSFENPQFDSRLVVEV